MRFSSQRFGENNTKNIKAHSSKLLPVGARRPFNAAFAKKEPCFGQSRALRVAGVGKAVRPKGCLSIGSGAFVVGPAVMWWGRTFVASALFGLFPRVR